MPAHTERSPSVRERQCEPRYDSLEKFVSLPGPADAGIPFVQISSEHVDRWFFSAGKNFKATQEDIDRTLSRSPSNFPARLEVDMNTDVQHIVEGRKQRRGLRSRGDR